MHAKLQYGISHCPWQSQKRVPMVLVGIQCGDTAAFINADIVLIVQVVVRLLVEKKA